MLGDVFDINIALISERNLVPFYRQEKHLAWLTALGTPLQQYHDKIFNDFADGGTDWDAVPVVGVREKLKYNSQTIVLEGILNKTFGVTSPPFIYIQNAISVEQEIFLTDSGDGYVPSYWGDSPNDPNTVFVGELIDYNPLYDFTVFVPTAVYNALGASNPARTARIQKEVDKYKLIGVTNNVTPY